MTCFAWSNLTLTLSLALVACSDTMGPDRPETAGTASPEFATVANSWSARAPRPPGATGLARLGFSAGMAPNSSGQSIVYLFGGHDQEGTYSRFRVESYNVATNSWGSSTAWLTASDMNGVGKIGNKLYFTGGSVYEEDGRIERRTRAYQPSTQQLTQKADMPRATYYGVTGVISGMLYVLPGLCSVFPTDPGHCDQGLIRQFYRYNPTTNSWTQRAAAPHYHRQAAAGVINGKFYVVGGGNEKGLSAVLDVYNPSTNSWKTLAPMPRAALAVGAVLRGKLFVVSWVTGSDGKPIIRSYAYDPLTNTWATKPSPPVVPDELVWVSLNGSGRLLAVSSSTTYLYTP
jgi:hypothetical protein